MKAILISVDYHDLLDMTLPYNRHHFESVMVVTAKRDEATQRIAWANDATVYCTDAFWARGASFNKWAALEEGLDQFGREGWLAILDADVLWPKVIPDWPRYVGYLYTPLRRMFTDLTQPIPPESEWRTYPVHKNVGEWAGYSQILHCNDHHLGKPPWHETDWRHAGGADSIFQAKWDKASKQRPPFECLHLGSAGENWYGRATAYLDGTVPPDAEAKREAVRRIWTGRAARRGKGEAGRYEGEKLGSP